MANLFEFNADAGETPDSLKTKRAIALMLARNSGGVAHNAGEGLAKVGNALAFAMAMSRLDSGQKDLASRQAGLWPALLGGTSAATSAPFAPTATAPAAPGNLPTTQSIPAEALSGDSLVNTPTDLSGGNLPAPASSGAADINIPDQYKPLIAQASKQYGVPASLLANTLHAESSFNPNAVSSAGAQGIAQFMPATAKSMGVNPFDPSSAIPGAAQYLAQNYAKFGSWPLALAAYNAGPGRVDQMLASGAGMKALPAETQGYVAKIMSGLGDLLGPTRAQAAEAPQVSNPRLAAMLSPDMTVTGQNGFQPSAVPLPQPRPTDAPASFADRFAAAQSPQDAPATFDDRFAALGPQTASTTELSPRARIAQALLQAPAIGAFTPQEGPEPSVTNLAVKPTTLPILSGRQVVAQALAAKPQITVPPATATVPAPNPVDARRAAVARLTTPNPSLKGPNGQPLSIAQAVALYGNPVQQKLVGTIMQNALVPPKPTNNQLDYEYSLTHPGFADFKNKAQAKFGFTPIYATGPDGKPLIVQLGANGQPNIVKLPNGVTVSTGVEKVDLGTQWGMLDKRSGQFLGYMPKDIEGKAKQEAVGKGQGAAENAYRSMHSKMPGLENVVRELHDLANKATYTTTGQVIDWTRKELGAQPREAAVARSRYIATVDNVILPLLRDTFGAQFTAREGDTLRATLGDPNKTPAEKQAVLESFIEQKRRDVGALATQAGNPPAPAVPSATSLPPPPPGFQVVH